EIGAVEVGDVRVIVIRIGRSWVAPHMVTFRGTSRFYRRNSAGKYQLDVDQIRNAFLRTAEGSIALRQFHNDRTTRIEDGGLPALRLLDDRKFVLHLLPLGGLEGTFAVDLPTVIADDRFRPMYSNPGGFERRYTIDGVVVHDGAGGNPVTRYLLMFRSG